MTSLSQPSVHRILLATSVAAVQVVGSFAEVSLARSSIETDGVAQYCDANATGSDKRCGSRAGISLLSVRRHSRIANSIGHLDDGFAFLVGNGPLTTEQRTLLAKAPKHKIYRFNGMPNLKMEEVVGNVFVRSFGSQTTGGYWGLSCCPTNKASCPSAFASNMCARVPEALSVVLLGGAQSKASEYNDTCSGRIRISLDVPTNLTNLRDPNSPPIVDLDGKNYSSPINYQSGFSSGFLGFVYLRAKHPQDDIHIMGMNWGEGLASPPHPFMMERDIIQSTKKVSVHIHQTPATTYHDRDANSCECNEAYLMISSPRANGMKRIVPGLTGVCSHNGALVFAERQAEANVEAKYQHQH